MQYRPNEVIGLSYLISDPADTGTYYVRAVLRDTRTNETLRTVNLTVDASNSRRFYGEMQMPDVKMNQSRSVDITTTVYTDSGYTSQSTEHQEICNMYIVAERWNEAMGFSGGGSGLTPKQVREALAKVLDAREAEKKPEEKQPEKKIELPKEIKKLLSDSIQSVKDAEKSLKKAIADSDSRESVSEAKKMLEAAVKSIPEAAKAAMQMLLKDMQRSDRSESSENVSKAVAEMKEAQNAIIEAIAEQFKPMVESIESLGKRMEKLETKQWGIVLSPIDNVKPVKKGETAAEEKEEDPIPPIGDFRTRALEKIGKK